MEIEPRAFRDDCDLAAMRSILIAGRQHASATYYVHIGDLDWWLFYLMGDDWRAQVLLWDDPVTGETIGWSLFSPAFSAFDVFVHPRELGTARWETIVRRTAQQLLSIMRERGGQRIATMWVGADDRRYRELLKQLGLKQTSYVLHMLARPLDAGIAAPTLPSRFTARASRGIDDADRRATAGHAAFSSLLSIEQYQANYRRFVTSPVYRPDLDRLIVAPDGQVAAFALAWLDPTNRVGLLEPVGAHPAFQRRGLATAVVIDALRALHAHGMHTAIVGTESDNPAALRLYESVGFRPHADILSYAAPIVG